MKVTFDDVPADEFHQRVPEPLTPTGIGIRKVDHGSDPPRYALEFSWLMVDPNQRHGSQPVWKEERQGLLLDERSLLLISQVIQEHFRPTVESRTLEVLEQILRKIDVVK